MTIDVMPDGLFESAGGDHVNPLIIQIMAQKDNFH